MTQLAGRGSTWGSVLSVDEFATVRSVGFEPVGQVFGGCRVPALRHRGSQLPRDFGAFPGPRRVGEVCGLGRPGGAGRAGAL